MGFRNSHRAVALAIVPLTILLLAGVVGGQGGGRAEEPPPGLRVGGYDAEVDVPLDLLNDDVLLEVSDRRLMLALQQVAARLRDRGDNRRVLIGLRRGRSSQAPFLLRFDMTKEIVRRLLMTPFAPLSTSGEYYPVDLVRVDTRNDFGNLVRLRPVSGAALEAPGGGVGATTPKGGICASITTAYSLLRRLGKKIPLSDATEKIDTDGNGTPETEVYKPGFLQGIYGASGDSDGNRGMSVGQVGKAHGYNPTNASPVFENLNKTIVNKPANTPCSDLAATAADLEDRLRRGDDLSLWWLGKEPGDAETGGHIVPIVRVSFSEGPPCVLKIEAMNAGVQDPKGDWKGVPVNPGIDTIWISSSSNGVTSVYSSAFPNFKIGTVGLLGYRR